VARGYGLLLVVGAGRRVLLGGYVTSGQVGYDVYVKNGVDKVGRDDFGEVVAHFVERDNAVALKRRLVARGETVRVERSVVHGLSEEEKERLFRDYSRVPEYELAREPAPSREPTQEPPGGPESVFEEPERAEPRSATGGAQEGAERVPWWRRVFGG
jgi:hypothetical protein